MNARTLLLRPSAGAALFAGVAFFVYACGGAPPSATTPDAAGNGAPGKTSHADLGGEKTCLDHRTPDQCADWFKKREDAVSAMRDLARASDVRSVPVGLRAMASRDPLLEGEGLRLVGPFAREKGVSAAALPFIARREISLQMLAAGVLRAAGDETSRLADQWKMGHGEDGTPTPYQREKLIDLVAAGWKQGASYPAAQPYPPASAENAAAFITKDTPPAVTAWLEKQAGQKATPVLALLERVRDQQSKVLSQAQAKVQAAMEKAQAEFQRTHDPSVFQKLEAQLKDVATPKPGLDTAPYPGDRSLLSEAQAVIFEEKSGVVARIGLSYREPLLDRTVLMLVWSSVDHSAPPTEVPPFNPPYVPNDGEVGP
jgi:hypothetical protein